MSENYIDLPSAIELTRRYKENKEALVSTEFNDSMHIAETFDASAIQAILNQPGCTHFRAYFGMKEDKKICLVFVGVNDQDYDMVGNQPYGEGIIVEYGRLCPPVCTINSPFL